MGTKRRASVKRPWTADDQRQLIELRHLGGVELAKRLGRTRGAVVSRAHLMGISVAPADHAIYVTNGRMWTSGDDVLLRTQGHWGYKRLAELLHRTPGAVRERARVLRVSLRRREPATTEATA